MEKEIITKEDTNRTLCAFANQENFKTAMVMSEALSKSNIIPKEYQGNPSNCMIAIELANRLSLSPFQVMQNTYIVYGKPSWSSQFLIACINASPRFKGGLKYDTDGATYCTAYAIDKETGEKLTGIKVTLAMADSEGWSTKNGSKWKTMPELMLRYRASSFFAKLYCPEIVNGMQTAEEMTDIGASQIEEQEDMNSHFSEEELAKRDALLKDLNDLFGISAEKLCKVKAVNSTDELSTEYLIKLFERKNADAEKSANSGVSSNEQ